MFWLLPEGASRQGWPHETLTLLDRDDMRDMGYGVFFCPNELGNVKNEKGNLRHDRNIQRITSVFLDMDAGTPEEQRARLSTFHLPPSALVRTGRGHHAYWILTGDVDMTHWQHVQRTMAQRLGGDPACVDPARLMRVPGTWHVKYEPRPVELIHLNEEWTYSLSEFNITPDTKKIFYLSPRPRDGTRRIIRPPRSPAVTHIEEGTRHMTLLKECARYLRGVAPSEVSDRTDELKSWYAQSSRPLKKNWEHEVEDIIQWVLKKELGNL